MYKYKNLLHNRRHFDIQGSHSQLDNLENPANSLGKQTNITEATKVIRKLMGFISVAF